LRRATAIFAVVLILLLTASGCDRNRPQSRVTETKSEVQTIPPLSEQQTAAVPSEPGTTVAGVTFDRSASETEYASAYQAAQQGLASALEASYAGRPGPLSSMPSILQRSRIELIPLSVLTTPVVDPPSVFSNSVLLRGQYIATVWLDGKMLGAYDWGQSLDQKVEPSSGQWGSFYGGFYLGFHSADAQLRRHFGSHAIRVRYVEAPHGYWVVGRAGSEEVAYFVSNQGFFPDTPSDAEGSTPAQVFEYTARDHSQE